MSWYSHDYFLDNKRNSLPFLQHFWHLLYNFNLIFLKDTLPLTIYMVWIGSLNVTRSRKTGSEVKKVIFFPLHFLLGYYLSFTLMKTPWRLGNWFSRYRIFNSCKDNRKERTYLLCLAISLNQYLQVQTHFAWSHHKCYQLRFDQLQWQAGVIFRSHICYIPFQLNLEHKRILVLKIHRSLRPAKSLPLPFTMIIWCLTQEDWTILTFGGLLKV